MAVWLVASASAASASLTIGQLAPGTPPNSCSNLTADWVQPTVTSGNSYVVPATGGVTSWTLTSWSTKASTTAGQHYTMKVLRHLTGVNYTVVAHDGPRALTAGMNTFATSLPVKAGDLLGMNDNSVSPFVSTACAFAAPGDTDFFSTGRDLADGQSGPIGGPSPNFRLNIAAVVTPTNSFTLGAVIRNKKKGTATITASVPNPGDLSVSGTGVRTSSLAAAPGEVQVTIAATGKRRKKLRRNGKVSLSPVVTFVPTGGESNAQSVTLQLKKKR
jgi:hypothetical protein